MLDIAWPELVVIGAVALVAIGPKDLPKVMRVIGVWAGKARGLMREIQQSMEQLSYEAEVADNLKKNPPPVEPAAATPPKPESDHDRAGNA